MIVQQEHDEVTLPLEIAKIYLKGNLIGDLVSLFPFHIYYPDYVFIRLIQCSKWYQFQKYFDDWFIVKTADTINKDL